MVNQISIECLVMICASASFAGDKKAGQMTGFFA
tara:strand:+ start:4160 stop:4261 length:102 start_codon:yes stop_codon:yes gene_type:complete